MMKKFYIKLYVYAFIILFTSTVLTSVVISFYFHQHQNEERRRPDFRPNPAQLVQMDLNHFYNHGLDSLKKRMDEINDELKISISYWQSDKLIYSAGNPPEKLSDTDILTLKMEKDKQFLHERGKDLQFRHEPPQSIFMYLDEKNIKKGFLLVEFGRRNIKRKPDIYPFGFFIPPDFQFPVLHILLTLFFLAILIIPYSSYVLQPLKTLLQSINKVSQGNLNYPIEIKKNDFKELADAFDMMRKKIQEMISQKQQMIADVSHELRSPLTRIRMGLEILGQDPDDKDEYIQQAIIEIEDLDHLIDDLLGISKLELATSKLNMEKTDLKYILEERIEKHKLLFENIKLTLKQSLPDCPAYIQADRSLIERVFNNLFSNLLKYAPSGSVADISLLKKNDTLRLSLRNRGQAIAREDYEKIFEPFYRADRSRSRKTGGTGLGLAITKKIIDSHDGKIWISEPEDNEGGVIFNLEFKSVA